MSVPREGDYYGEELEPIPLEPPRTAPTEIELPAGGEVGVSIRIMDEGTVEMRLLYNFQTLAGVYLEPAYARALGIKLVEAANALDAKRAAIEQGLEPSEPM